MAWKGGGASLPAGSRSGIFICAFGQRGLQPDRRDVCLGRFYRGAGVCCFLWKLCGGGFLRAYDPAVGGGSASCVLADLCQCKFVRLVARRDPILDQRNGGRDAAEKLTSKAGLEQIDGFFEKYGKNTILICRLLPFVSFDLVSYAAGLTSMPFWSFFIATGIGQLPATLVYSYVGGMLTGGARLFVTGLMILFALSALIVMLRRIYMEKQRKKQ